MTNEKLIQEFKQDPQRRMSSSHFRTFNGILFNRVPNSRHDNAWYPVFIYDEIGLLNYMPYHRLPERYTWRVRNAIASIKYKLLVENKTVVEIESANELTKDLMQPLKLRNVPNRTEFIKNIMNYHMRSTFPKFYSTYEHSGRLDIEEVKAEAYKIAWEFAITSVAKQHMMSKKTIESSLNRIINIEAASSIGSIINDLFKFIKKDDIDAADEVFHDLKNNLKTLGNEVHKLNDDILRAKGRSKKITLNQVCGLTRDQSIIKSRRESNLGSSHSGYDILTIENNNILKGWSDFTRFLKKLDIEVPTPFDTPLDINNVANLAAFYDISLESFIDFTKHLDQILLDREPTDYSLYHVESLYSL